LRDVFREAAADGHQPRHFQDALKTPWVGDPRINIQDDKGKAKAYQVRQVLLAIEKLEGMRNER
jgi:hypothetical protein